MTHGRGLHVEARSNLVNISAISRTTESPVFAAKYLDLSQSWHALRIRMQIYANAQGYPSFTKSWLSNKNINRRFLQIRRGLDALDEISRDASLPAGRKALLLYQIRRGIETEFAFLEVIQYKKLIKDQDVSRPDLGMLESSLKSKIKVISKEIKKAHANDDLPIESFRSTRKFCKNYKRLQINFDKHLRRSEKVSDVLTATSNTVKVASESLSATNLVIQAVPALAAIGAAAPLVMNAVRSWREHRSQNKKIIDSVIAVGVIGAIIVAGAVPAATAIIASALITAGVVKEYIKPVFDLYSMIKNKQKELNALPVKLQRIETAEPSAIKLDARDKTALLRQIEMYCTSSHVQVSVDEIKAVRDLIGSSETTCSQLLANNLVKLATGSEDVSHIKQYLLNSAKEDERRLTQEIAQLKNQRAKAVTLAFNGLLTIIGTILVCIPTPPTLLMGTALLSASALINIVVKYDLVQKAKGYFKNIFQKQPENAEPEKQADLGNHKSFKLNQSMQNFLRRFSSNGQKQQTNEREKQPDKVPGAAPPTPQEAAPRSETADSPPRIKSP